MWERRQPSSGSWNDIGESGGYSPSATASSCEKGGSAFGEGWRPIGDGGSGGWTGHALEGGVRWRAAAASTYDFEDGVDCRLRCDSPRTWRVPVRAVGKPDELVWTHRVPVRRVFGHGRGHGYVGRILVHRSYARVILDVLHMNPWRRGG